MSMTAEEYAARIQGEFVGKGVALMAEDVLELVRKHIREAIRDERETCAREVESMSAEAVASSKEHSSRFDIFYVRRERAAAVIRARNAKAG